MQPKAAKAGGLACIAPTGMPRAACVARSNETLRANLSAPSLASVPELAKKTLEKWRELSTSWRASRSGSHVCRMFDTCCTLAACCAMTPATPASEWPSAFTAMPPKKST